MYKFIVTHLIFLFVFMIMPVSGKDIDNSRLPDYATGKVIKIISETQNKELQESFGGNQVTQLLEVKILSGEYKGKIVKIENQLTSNPAYDIKIKPGNRVILDIEKNKDHPDIYISDVERAPALMIITGLFFVLVLVIGGIRGLRSLISLGITTFLVFFVLFPAILNNYPIIPVTMLIVLVSTVFTMFIVGGINVKSLSASIGTITSIAIAGLIAALVIKIAPLTGFYDQESIMLWSSRPDLNYTGLLTSAMIIGALGAVMDVGMSIASSITEVKNTDKSLTFMQLTKSGLNVGKDIMGTMSNTLILAYVGGVLPLLLLAVDVPMVKFINLNSIATEITAAIAGSIGIVLCIPITAVVAGYLIGNKKNI
ncbi:MAG: YibE/F family protein [bacterium]